MYRHLEWKVAGQAALVLGIQAVLLWGAASDHDHSTAWAIAGGLFAVFALRYVIFPAARLLDLVAGADRRNLLGWPKGGPTEAEVLAEGERVIAALSDKRPPDQEG